jgi:hypothetical protein
MQRRRRTSAALSIGYFSFLSLQCSCVPTGTNFFFSYHDQHLSKDKSLRSLFLAYTIFLLMATNVTHSLTTFYTYNINHTRKKDILEIL